MAAPSDRPRKFGMKVSEEDRVLAARNPPLILSCSRRTDVPWAFLRQYLNGFEDGFIYVASGARKGTDQAKRGSDCRAVCVQPWDNRTQKGVVCISWWSKNYKKWIAAYQRPDSILHRYAVHLFNFTVNSENLDLEPGMETSLQERLDQVTYLARTFGPYALSCRFDPIVHYRSIIGGPVRDNLRDFETIVRHIGGLGIDYIVFSFCQAYPKSVRNMKAAGLELVTLNRAEECAVLDKLMPIAHRYGVQLRCCGDKGLVGYPIIKSQEEALISVAKREVPQHTNIPVIGQSRCVDAKLADRIAREKGLNVFLSQAKDLRQRKACECTRSTDIGQYTFQCPHGCLYCYANPMKKSSRASAPPPQVTDQAPIAMNAMPPPSQFQPAPLPPPFSTPGMPLPMNAPPPFPAPAAPAGYMAAQCGLPMTTGGLPPPPLPQSGFPIPQMGLPTLLMQAYKFPFQQPGGASYMAPEQIQKVRGPCSSL